VTLAGLQWLVVSWAPLAGLRGTVPLSGTDWLVLTVAVLRPVGLLEVAKTGRVGLVGAAMSRWGSRSPGTGPAIGAK
jgi:hypothetical protein